MNEGLPPWRTLVLLALVLWLAGCARSPSARYYVLNPLDPREAKAPAGAAANPVSVGIAPVEIPDYLERPEMVTRDGRNALKLDDYDRWAGSLSSDIAAVLAQNLALLLGTDRIYLLPVGRGQKPQYLLAMRVLRLDCVPGDQALLQAQWTLAESDGKDRKVATRVMTFSERLSDTSYQAMARGVSGALAQASREIAREITGLGEPVSQPQAKPQVFP
jgi:uncharacterized lipoprotein YmbA